MCSFPEHLSVSLFIQPLMRLVSGGAVLLILLRTVLIPFDDLADPLWALGAPYLPKCLWLAFFFFLSSFITAAPTILRYCDTHTA